MEHKHKTNAVNFHKAEFILKILKIIFCKFVSCYYFILKSLTQKKDDSFLMIFTWKKEIK